MRKRRAGSTGPSASRGLCDTSMSWGSLMSIQVNCDNCRLGFTVLDSSAGKRINCPHCDQAIDTPAVSALLLEEGAGNRLPLALADDDLDIRLRKRKKRRRRACKEDIPSYQLTAEERIRRRAEAKEKTARFWRIWGNLGIGAILFSGGVGAMLASENYFGVGLCALAVGLVTVFIALLNAAGVRILHPDEYDDD